MACRSTKIVSVWSKVYLNMKELSQGCYMKLTWMKDVTVFYTTVGNVILSILRSQMDFHSTEIHLGSQNWQDYISNGCEIYCNILHSSEFHVAALWWFLHIQVNLALASILISTKNVQEEQSLIFQSSENLGLTHH